MDKLRDNEEIVLDWYNTLLTKEYMDKCLDKVIWRVYHKGNQVLKTAIDTYALDHFAVYVKDH